MIPKLKNDLRDKRIIKMMLIVQIKGPGQVTLFWVDQNQQSGWPNRMTNKLLDLIRLRPFLSVFGRKNVKKRDKSTGKSPWVVKSVKDR